MNAEQLLQHFERISEAPDAIPRLRRFILDLAVRGKLVEQDPSDEPAAELLKRIGAEKVRLVKAGKIKAKLSLAEVTDEQAPYKLPSSWQWVRFANIVDFSAGRTPSRNEPKFWNSGDYHWVSIADMEEGQVLTATKETVSREAREQVFGSEPEEPGTIIMSFKLTIGKIARLGIPAFHNEAIISIRPHIGDLDAYLFKVLPQFARQGDTKGAIKGATLNRESISNIFFPLPPLAEQHRIVAKVDELMSLCDQLEAAKAEREQCRDSLVAASLQGLNRPAEEEETFSEHARFTFTILPSITTRAAHIKQLRQTILNLAVRGKLVEQRVTDGSALDELKSIIEQRKDSKKGRRVSKVTNEGEALNIIKQTVPFSWICVRLGDIVDPLKTISYGVLVPGDNMSGGVPLVRAQDLYLSGHPSRPTKCIAPEVESAYARTRLEGGEILLCVVGSIGKIGIVPQEWAGANIARAVARIKPIPQVERDYLLLFLQSQNAQSSFKGSTRTLAQPTLNIGLIEQTPIPLPPLAEQNRIVAKVDELMSLCDQLEAQITMTEQNSRRFLEACLEVAISPRLDKVAL